MNLRFGIREKFAIFAFVLVLAVALLLPNHLSKLARGVVESHELGDLQDEAALRCWEMMDSNFQLRRQLVDFAKDKAKFDRLKEYLVGSLPTAAQMRSAPPEDIPEWWTYILSMQIVSVDGTSEKLFNNPGIPSPGAPPAELLVEARKEVGARTMQPPTIYPLVVPSEFDPRSRVSAKNETAGRRRLIPVIWAVQQMEPEKDKVLVVMVSLDRGRSPRHLSFLLDEKGNYLMHPFLDSNEKPEPIYKDFDLFAECKLLTQGHIWGRVGLDVDMRVQRSDYPREQQALSRPFYFYEGHLGKKLQQAFEQEYERNRVGLLQWSDDLRMELERDGVPFGPAAKSNNLLRLLARSEDDLREARSKVEAAYRERYPDINDKVIWNRPVSLEHGDIQFTRFYLFPPQRDKSAAALPNPPYYFAYGAFREELASSIDHDMESMHRDALLLAIGAGTLAFITAFYFVRPLIGITNTARSVTVAGEDAGGLQHQIEALRGSLPVRRRDEVGDIARSLESLLRQVLNGHEQLRQLNADLDNRVREQTAELREANDQLRGLASAKDAFLASVSHELRQPLNSIFGFMQFLELSDLDEEQRRDMGKLRTAAAYLRRLIDDILDYQKIIMGGVELEPEDIDTAAFLASLRDSMTPQVQEKNNRLEFRCAPGVGTIFNDRARLQQVLLNLLSNACKFTQGGTIGLDARREKDATDKEWVVFDVSDSGRGMKPEELQGLFVRFKKLSAREGNKSGTGLGLVISQGLCLLMGGSVTCRSEFGKGSTFTVRVPVTVSGKLSSAILRKVQASQVAPPPVPHNGLVLVIDDDDGVRELMTRYLESKGYRVITADDGEKGVALAAQHRPAVITLDIVLPGAQNGWEVLVQLKSDPATAEIPVIIITFLEEPRQGLALGAADYIVKPIAWDQLSASLKKVTRGLGGDGSETAPVLVVDDDPEVRELFRRTLARDHHSVIEAADGSEALQQLRSHRPSVILLDLMMPVMDGFEFVTEFHKHPEWRDIPVVVITARHITREEREALRVSARAFLEKSGFTQEDLLARVLELVHQHAPAPQATSS